jgi:hypothetical protein
MTTNKNLAISGEGNIMIGNQSQNSNVLTGGYLQFLGSKAAIDTSSGCLDGTDTLELRSTSTRISKNLAVDGKITNGTTFVPKFFAGTTVANFGGGNSYPIFSTSGLNSTFGVTNVTGLNTVAFFANGDGGASEAHTTGATFLNSDNKWYVTVDRNVPGSMRVNYLVIYFG